MPFVVIENCLKCKHTDCVNVCPVDCFYEADEFLVINPDECIDCALCVPECPVDAIVADDEVPVGQEVFIEINAQLSRTLPNLSQSKDPPADAPQWKDVSDKRHQTPQISSFLTKETSD